MSDTASPIDRRSATMWCIRLGIDSSVVEHGTGAQDRRDCDQIVRGYFGLGDHDNVVLVTSSAHFLLHIWARNVEVSQGGFQFLTPSSQFRTAGSTGAFDGLVLDVPAKTEMTLGTIGAQGGETIDVSNAFGARVRSS